MASSADGSGPAAAPAARSADAAAAKLKHSALVVTVIEAQNLTNTQFITAQDPYVRATWVRNHVTAQTEYVWGGGTSPVWEKRGSCSNVLRLDIKKRRVAGDGTESLERQNAESFPNALLLEVLNSNWMFDDKISFAILNFSDDRQTCWLERPTGGAPSKKSAVRLDAGRITLDLSLPVGQGTVSPTGGKLVVTAHFE